MCQKQNWKFLDGESGAFGFLLPARKEAGGMRPSRWGSISSVQKPCPAMDYPLLSPIGCRIWNFIASKIHLDCNNHTLEKNDSLKQTQFVCGGYLCSCFDIFFSGFINPFFPQKMIGNFEFNFKRSIWHSFSVFVHFYIGICPGFPRLKCNAGFFSESGPSDLDRRHAAQHCRRSTYQKNGEEQSGLRSHHHS